MKIELKDIKKSYQIPGQDEFKVLKGINFLISQGEYISIIGRSGCGKTTLLKIVGLLDIPTEGDVIIDGVKEKELWNDELADLRRRKLGFIFQDYFLLEHLTVLDNMILPALLDKAEEKKSLERAEELANYLQIDNRLLLKYPKELSGGEKQRVAIARALFNDPDILVADEPSGNLDEQSKKNVEKIFKDLHENINKSILLVTHDLEFAKWSEKCYQLQNGVLVKG